MNGLRLKYLRRLWHCSLWSWPGICWWLGESRIRPPSSFNILITMHRCTYGHLYKLRQTVLYIISVHRYKKYKSINNKSLHTWYRMNFIHSCVSAGCSLSRLLNSSVLPDKSAALCPVSMSCFGCSGCSCCPFPCSHRAVEESYTPRGFTDDVCVLFPALTR